MNDIKKRPVAAWDRAWQGVALWLVGGILVAAVDFAERQGTDVATWVEVSAPVIAIALGALGLALLIAAGIGLAREDQGSRP